MARFSEEERKTIWDMQEAGVPVKRIAKHLDRQNSSLRKFMTMAGRGPQLVSAPSCGCHWLNGKRSREGWPLASPSEASLLG
jgi:transposase-like protein